MRITFISVIERTNEAFKSINLCWKTILFAEIIVNRSDYGFVNGVLQQSSLDILFISSDLAMVFYYKMAYEPVGSNHFVSYQLT